MQGGNCNPDPNQRRVTVMISDVCEPCSPPGDDHIDLQALTFLKVAADLSQTCSTHAACCFPARDDARGNICNCMYKYMSQDQV